MRFLKHNFKIFLSSRYLPAAVLSGYAVIHIFLLFQNHWYQSGELSTYLNSTQNVGILCYLLMGFVTFEFFYIDKDSRAAECFEIDRRVYLKLLCGKLLLMLPAVILIGITVFVYDFTAVCYWDALTIPVVISLILYSILNIVLLGLAAVLLGAVLASWLRRIASYAILIAECFLLLPAAKNILNVFPLPLDQISIDFTRIIDFFALAAPDTDWIPDSIYGLSIEACRWDLAIFWISFLFLLFLKKYLPKRKRKTKSIMILLGALSLAGFCGFVQMGSDSVVRLDQRTNGTAYGDSSYDTFIGGVYQEEEAGFEILAYCMEVSVKRRLEVHADITFTCKESSENSDGYQFTLYRGYKVTSVTDEDGNVLEFSQNGDYLEIQYLSEEDTGTICISYCGSGNRYYSNYQGIALPAYFPWYPIAGWQDMSWLSEGGNVNTLIDDKDKEFQITLDTNLTVVSNLEETTDSVYEGTAVGVTFIGGLLVEKETAGITYWASPIDLSEPALDSAQDTLDRMEEILEIDLAVDLSECTIICMPGILSRTAVNISEIFVVFPDHVLAASEGWTLVGSVISSMLPEMENVDELRELFVEHLAYGESGCLYNLDAYYADVVQKPDYEDLILLEEGENIVSEETEEALYLYEQLLHYQFEQLGYEEVMQACWDYLNNISDYAKNQVDFLYDLDRNLGEN